MDGNKIEPTPIDVDYNERRRVSERSLLIWGILSIALAYLFPVAGLIISIIAQSNIKRHLEVYGELIERGNLVNGLTTGGLILSIVLLVGEIAACIAALIYFIVVVGAISIPGLLIGLA